MRKIVLAIMATISGLVMVFSYHTSTTSEVTTNTDETDGGNTQATTGTTTTTAPDANPTAAATSAAEGTFTGDAVRTRYGAVQVQITVANGQITSAEAIQYPNQDRHDQQINAYAVPILNSEVVAAQGASIDAVSGATVTSAGYIESLQSAIDAAHLA